MSKIAARVTIETVKDARTGRTRPNVRVVKVDGVEIGLFNKDDALQVAAEERAKLETAEPVQLERNANGTATLYDPATGRGTVYGSENAARAERKRLNAERRKPGSLGAAANPFHLEPARRSNNPPRIAWTCSYMGVVTFRIHDESGSYEADLRVRLDDYERSILNGGPDGVYALQVESTIGFLIRRTGSGPISLETVRAFNAWRHEEAAHWNRVFDEEAERYQVPAGDPLRAVSWLAAGSCHWEGGQDGRYVFSHLESRH